MIEAVIPYTSGDLINRIHKEAEVISETHEGDGTHIKADCPAALADFIENRLKA